MTLNFDLIRDHRLDFVDLGGEGAQANFLGICNVLGFRFFPLGGHRSVLIGIHKQVKAARCFEQRQEGHGSGDLTNDLTDFVDNLFFWLGATTK